MCVCVYVDVCECVCVSVMCVWLTHQGCDEIKCAVASGLGLGLTRYPDVYNLLTEDLPHASEVGGPPQRAQCRAVVDDVIITHTHTHIYIYTYIYTYIYIHIYRAVFSVCGRCSFGGLGCCYCRVRVCRGVVLCRCVCV